MKICIPTEDEKGLEATVSGHFGRAAYFAFVDSETKAVEFVMNTDTGHDHGRCTGAALAASKRPEAVLTSGMGQGAFKLLTSYGAHVYRAPGAKLGEAIDGFASGSAEELVSSEAAGHHHEGKAHHAHHSHGNGGCCGNHAGHGHRH